MNMKHLVQGHMAQLGGTDMSKVLVMEHDGTPASRDMKGSGDPFLHFFPF